MAYSDDISNLGADHHWKFDGDSTDTLGSVTSTDTSMLYTGSAIAKDASNSAKMNQRACQVSLASTVTINNGAHARKAVAGWFMVSAKELPTCTIYSEGNATTNFMILIFPGNSVMLQIRDSSNFQIQVYSDIALEADRAYHLGGILEGSGYGNEVRFYIDGVEQTDAEPSDRQPDDASLAVRTGAYFGDASSTGPNGVNLTMDSPGDNRTAEQVIDAFFQHWCAWGDEADAVLTETEIRETLFERGALAEETITGQADAGAAQSAFEAVIPTTTVLPNETCSAEFDDLTTPADFTIYLDDITFDDLTSIHIRNNSTAYTLTIINQNGSNCSKVSAPFGGDIEVFTEVTVQVTVRSASDLSLITGAMVLLEADTGGDLPAGTDIIKTTTSAGVVSVDFNYSADQPVTGVVRKGSASAFYQEGIITGTITENGLDLTVLLVEDE